MLRVGGGGTTTLTVVGYGSKSAGAVLHATKNLHTTMKHVRELLKPGGMLLLIKATADRLEGQLIFRTLLGWWLREEPERQKSPNALLKI
jgi:hypothetical protein